jgi:hypothetical protein
VLVLEAGGQRVDLYDTGSATPVPAVETDLGDGTPVTVLQRSGDGTCVGFGSAPLSCGQQPPAADPTTPRLQGRAVNASSMQWVLFGEAPSATSAVTAQLDSTELTGATSAGVWAVPLPPVAGTVPQPREFNPPEAYRHIQVRYHLGDGSQVDAPQMP